MIPIVATSLERICTRTYMYSRVKGVTYVDPTFTDVVFRYVYRLRLCITFYKGFSNMTKCESRHKKNLKGNEASNDCES